MADVAPTIIQIKIDKAHLDTINQELTRLHGTLTTAQEPSIREWAAKQIEKFHDDLMLMRRTATNQPATATDPAA